MLKSIDKNLCIRIIALFVNFLSVTLFMFKMIPIFSRIMYGIISLLLIALYIFYLIYLARCIYTKMHINSKQMIFLGACIIFMMQLF